MTVWMPKSDGGWSAAGNAAQIAEGGARVAEGAAHITEGVKNRRAP
jgi:hypothetical protein